MAKRSRKNISKVIAIIASLVLALGLLPVTASAAGEGPDNAGGQAPDTPHTVAAAGPEAPPASPEKTDNDAAEGGKAVDGDAQDGAGASDGKSEETGAGKAGALTGGNGEGTPEAAPAGAGGAEGKGGPAGQADNPAKAGGPETAAPAAGNGAAAAGGQAAAEPVGAKAKLPAFKQSKTVGGVTVAVEADAGAFPEGARLSVASVPSSRTEAAVAPERDANENVAASYTFDIKVLDADGAELQPAGGKSVRVSFAAAEVADPNLDVSVYHVSGGEVEELAVSESGTTATATSGGFSYYTVEFTYGEMQYVLQGGGSVPLADVLATVGLEGEPTAAASSDPDLFAVARDASGIWTVSARRAFTSAETLTVTVNGTEYFIAVTDDQSGTCGDGVTWTLDNNGKLTISGTGEMYNFSDEAPWYGSRNGITAVVINDGVTSIGDHAFDGCTKLAGVEIPSSVTSIGYYAFHRCTKLASVKIPSSVTSIGNSAFKSCTSLKSVEIPSSVTSIGNSAFFDCYNLESVTIPDAVTSIGYYAFSNCYSLESVTIPSSVTSIGDHAFQRCDSLTGVEIPGSVMTIEDSAFRDCRQLSSMTFGGSKAQWDYKVEKGEDWAGGTTPTIMITYEKWGVAALASPAAGGMVNDEAVFVASFDKGTGGKAELTATPNEGYVFANWTGNGITEPVADNPYEFEDSAQSDRTLTANFKPVLTITAKDQAYTYDGTWQGPGDTAHGSDLGEIVTVAGLQPGDSLKSIVIDGQGKDVGDYALTPSNVAIDGNADNYAISYVPGKLTIEPAPLTVTTGSAAKAYDGKALTNSEAKITGLVNGETAAVEATGSQTEVGSSANTYSIKWGTADPKNYTVTERLGTLTVEAAPARKGTLTFDLAGGTLDGKTGSITVEADVGDTIKLPKAPTKKGYAFKFWKGSEYAAGAEYKVEGDHAFAAEWAAVHTVTFDANGHGKAPDAQTVEHGNKAKRPANPTADGYTFGGWYTDKACKEAYDFSAPVTEDVTLYAKWTKKPSSGSGTSPKTGDPLAGAFAIALALAAASALALALSRRRSRG